MDFRGLFPGKDAFDRPLQQVCSHGGLSLNREIFFRAEGAAAGGKRDFNFLDGKVQDPRDILQVENRTLMLREHLDSFSLRHRQAGFRLQESDFHRLRLECLFNDDRGFR